LIVDASAVCPTYGNGTTHESICGCDKYHYYNNAQIMYDIGEEMAFKNVDTHANVKYEFIRESSLLEQVNQNCMGRLTIHGQTAVVTCSLFVSVSTT
jgi:hypothetical protein